MARPDVASEVTPPHRTRSASRLQLAGKDIVSGEAARGTSIAADLASVASLAAAVVFVLSVVRLGWVSDDAFITIRSVEQLLAGNGFGLNPGVRVQAFTSPLWALFCVPLRWLSGDPYGALVLGGLACTVGLTVLLCWWLRALPWRAPLSLLALAASTSFVEFSTSGLENSLTHLLIAAFCLERLRHPARPTTAMFALAAALFLTRFDLALIVVPTLAISSLSAPRMALRRALAPLVAVAAWLGFATLYYGFPHPNTALAKLNVKLPLLAKVGRGFEYVLDVATRDPLVLVVFGVATALALRRSSCWAARGLQLGALLYLLYVIAIGGDFMSGRFFTAIYLVSVLVALALCKGLLAAPLTAGIMALPLAVGAGLVLRGEGGAPERTECRVPITGIVNERACYAEHTALAQNVGSAKWRTHGYLAAFEKALAETPEDVVVFDLVGMATYGADRQVHIVERYALSDPLLARIRVEPKETWRAGHFPRPLPNGYLETLRIGENHLDNACLRRLYADLQQVTRGPLWSKERLQSIWRLNTQRAFCAL